MPLGMTFTLATAEEERETRAWSAGRAHALVGEMADLAGIPGDRVGRLPLPFTLSAPMPSGEDREAAGRGAAFRLRLTWLDDEEARCILERVPQLLDRPIPGDPGRAPLFVRGVRAGGDPQDGWSRHAAYPRLVEGASSSLRLITLKFCSATVLERAEGAYPLPDPGAIFLAYLDLWDAFSAVRLAPGLRRAIGEALRVEDFRLRRTSFRADGRTVPAFRGSVTFRMAGRHPESVLRGLNVLADYAFFCGTGMHREAGMGMTRRVLGGARERGVA